MSQFFFLYSHLCIRYIKNYIYMSYKIWSNFNFWLEHSAHAVIRAQPVLKLVVKNISVYTKVSSLKFNYCQYTQCHKLNQQLRYIYRLPLYMYIYYSHLKLGQAESLYLSDLVWTLLTMLQEKKKKKKEWWSQCTQHEAATLATVKQWSVLTSPILLPQLKKSARHGSSCRTVFLHPLQDLDSQLHFSGETFQNTVIEGRSTGL